MIGTYAAVLAVCGASLAIGQAAIALCGGRRWSWLAPAVGLALVCAVCWGTVRMPGQGAISAVAVLLLAVGAVLYLRGRVDGAGEALRAGLPVALLALAAASLPFAVEGHFGILGTGFDPDMSQHLLATDRLAEGSGSQLLHQGYPLGPHAIVVALSKGLGIGPVQGFSGLTVAVAVLAPLTALAAFAELPPLRRTAAALLVGLPYMVASYLAQGAFKETMQALFVLAFALSLRESTRAWSELPLRFVPAAAIAVGSVYVYSFPGLVWLVATGVIWGAAELVIARSRSSAGGVGVESPAPPEGCGGQDPIPAGDSVPPPGAARRARGGPTPATGPADLRASSLRPEQRVGQGGHPTPATGPAAMRSVLLALAVFLVGALPELGRMIDFHSFETFDPAGPGLGNLFGQLSPFEALGIWPSGDFRVAPGDGAAPAFAFYLGIAFASALLVYGLLRCWRRRETAIVAALLVAGAVYAAARVGGTPYTAAKAIEVAAPLATLVILAPLLDRRVEAGKGRAAGAPLAGLAAAAFLLAAGGGSLLALASAPVGPTAYTPRLTELRPLIASDSTLVLAPERLLREEHGARYIAWELRGGRVCIDSEAAAGGALPAGIRFVVTMDSAAAAPFGGLALRRRAAPYLLWERIGSVSGPSPCPLIAVRQARQGPAR
ncbi:MAG: hypothetical protein FVQ78_02725 [Solirubrobacterales bacterium]|nr:hypothetical protein [Solirubrobacterales bacterium]